MSNDEASPTIEAERACVDEARLAGVELLLPREVPLGGPRALPVLRSLPNKHRRMVGAWCFADAFGPVDLAGGPGMRVPPHPHTGLQTVSWLVQGRIEHRDSTGCVHTVGPGGVNLMTAGSGIAHSEYSTDDSTVLHGVQLWVALPAAHRAVRPEFAGLDAVPSLPVDAATVRVFMGSLAGATAPTRAYSPIVGAEVGFASGGDARIPVEPGWEHGVLALTDGIELDGVALPIGAIGTVDAGRDALTIRATGPAVAILLGGEPFDEQFVMFWNFIGADHEAVAEARETWMRERDAEPADRERFGTVADDANGSLPSPRIPDVVLLPQGRARRR